MSSITRRMGLSTLLGYILKNNPANSFIGKFANSKYLLKENDQFIKIFAL